MELMSGRETKLNPKETYSVFVDITCTNQATHFFPLGERLFETGEPIRIRRIANIVCDTNGLQSPSDEIR